ncbi:tubulin-tyrosine ligase [Agrocybe pediades]|nr:tubulin-tyrosine ligase [Agrocybe pediades]
MSNLNAFLSWPSAPLTDRLVRNALEKSSLSITLIDSEQLKTSPEPLLQWCTYDDIDHELLHFKRNTVLASSYTFRKAIIRKHYLSQIIRSYLKKKPDSILRNACPRTFEVEISFADELDEMWADELWDLGEELDSGSSWWILKPGMADRGMGIRIFHSKDDLQRIFEEFEMSDSEDEGEDREGKKTSVVTSQLRHFVIQEYVNTPLLLDPTETSDKRPADDLVGRKFHLRVYCVSRGAIQLYVYDRVLALFSSEQYTSLPPKVEEEEDTPNIDLRSHLTNTSLQTELGESNVRLLDELEGCHILSGDGNDLLTRSDIQSILSEVSEVLAEAFKAALQNPVHFQALPNAFELYGVDFLVSHNLRESGKKFDVKILEINSEPAIELTGPRLTWILEDLFVSMAKVCIEPFFMESCSNEPWAIGEVKYNLIKCLDEDIRGPGTQ